MYQTKLQKLYGLLLLAECFINLGDATEASGCILESSTIFPLSPDVLYMVCTPGYGLRYMFCVPCFNSWICALLCSAKFFKKHKCVISDKTKA